MWKWIVLGLVVIALIGILAVTIYVEREAAYRNEVLASGPAGKVLILYHPSRDAHFSDDLTMALARGFEDAKLTVERSPMTGATPARPEGYDIIAVVSNTFYQHPDWPTMRYLERADFKGVPTIGIMAGSGSTERARVALTNAIKAAGADLRSTRSLWIALPNDPARPDADNRAVAAELARKLALDTATDVLSRKQLEQQVAALVSPR